MMPRAHRQEALSRAYVATIAAMAGVLTTRPEPDYGIDLSLREVEQIGNVYADTGVQFDVQLRSTIRADIVNQEITYDLDVDTYNHLRRVTSGVPRILVLFWLPAIEGEWFAQSTTELCIRRCCYWISLEGQPQSASTATVRIRIPETQVFTPAAVLELIETAKQRRNP